jgi:dedicated sortase system histidine kinase
MKSDKRRLKISIRAKLLLLSIAVLGIPYVGYEYLREMERHLRNSLESSLIDAANAMAGPLHERELLFNNITAGEDDTLYVHALNNPVQLDGYTDDWLAYLDWSDIYGKSDSDSPLSAAGSDSFKLIVSTYQHYFYALLQVYDKSVIYSTPDADDTINGDHVVLVYTDPAGRLQRNYFSPSAPGEIRPFRYESYDDEYGFEYQGVRYVTNITAVWQQTNNGYNLELVIPADLVGDHLGLYVRDVDDARERVITGSIGTSGPDTINHPGRILQSSPEIKRIIKALGRTEGRRIWVLDNQGRVLASGGSLERHFPDNVFNIIYSLILPPAYERFKDDLAGASRLQGDEVQTALSGMTDTRWRSSPDNKAVIISVATPVWVNNQVRGAVVVEETTNKIQTMQRQALASLFNKTLIVFFIVTMLLLLFATRISTRLYRLSREAEAAIDEYGRVKGTVAGSDASDEIGDLSRSYAAMLKKLKQYNEYLEGMASRLSHELRTPMAIVQSSLERIHAELDDEISQPYLDRAQQGIERLNILVSRLSEAARLEQALQSAERESVDLCSLLRSCVDGYQQVYANTRFNLVLPDGVVGHKISPDLFVQMLDKLVSNAVDFNYDKKPIEISLTEKDELIAIRVTNYGSQLPKAMEGQLFNSMISIRKDKKGNEPHLGLGLYIARLIAEFHGGRIKAENLTDEDGVSFSIILTKNSLNMK